jgi:hypothetical protein
MKRILLLMLLASMPLSSSLILGSAGDKKDEKKNQKTPDDKSGLDTWLKAIQQAVKTGSKLAKTASNIAAQLEEDEDEEPQGLMAAALTAAKFAGRVARATTDRRGNLDLAKLNALALNKRKSIALKLLAHAGFSEAQIGQFVNLDQALETISLDSQTGKPVYDQTKFFNAINITEQARKQIVLNVFRKAGIPRENISKYVNLDEAIKALQRDPQTGRFVFDKTQLLKAINNDELSKKIGQLLDVPQEVVQNPLDQAKELLGLPPVAATNTYKPEDVDSAHQQIRESACQVGAALGCQYSCTGLLSAAGAYLVWSNPYTAAGYVALTGAHLAYQGGNMYLAKIKQNIAQAENVISSQQNSQAALIERFMKMMSFKSQVVGLGAMAAASYLSGDAAQGKADLNQQEIERRLSSEYVKQIGELISSHPEAFSALDQDEITKYLLQPYSLITNLEFIQSLGEATSQYGEALVGFIKVIASADTLAKHQSAFALLAVKPALVLNDKEFLKSLSEEQLYALHAILTLSKVESAKNFNIFVQKLEGKRIAKLSNPAILLVAEFNPLILADEKEFIASLQDNNELKEIFAQLLQPKKA